MSDTVNIRELNDLVAAKSDRLTAHSLTVQWARAS